MKTEVKKSIKCSGLLCIICDVLIWSYFLTLMAFLRKPFASAQLAPGATIARSVYLLCPEAIDDLQVFSWSTCSLTSTGEDKAIITTA